MKLTYLKILIIIVILTKCQMNMNFNLKIKNITKEQIIEKINTYSKYIERDSCMITYFSLLNILSIDPEPIANDLIEYKIDKFEIKRSKKTLSLNTIANKFISSVNPTVKNLTDDEYLEEILKALNKGFMVGIDFLDGIKGSNHYLQVLKPDINSSKIIVLQSFEGDYDLNSWMKNDDMEFEWNDSSSNNDKLQSLYNISFTGKMRKNDKFKSDSDDWWQNIEKHGITVRFNKFPIDLKRKPNMDSLRRNSKNFWNEKDKRKRQGNSNVFYVKSKK